MVLQKLTSKAITVINNISRTSEVTSGEVLFAVKDVLGMGAFVLQNFPNLRFDFTKEVKIDLLVKESYYQSIKLNSVYVGTEHILLALLSVTSCPDYERIRSELSKLNVFPGAIKNTENGKKTPLLDTFGFSLNQKTLHEFENSLIDRDEYNSLVSALLQRHRSSVLIVGEPGIGKTKLVELLARNINSLDVPSALAGYHVVEFDLLSFMTNAFNKMGVELGLATLSEELRTAGRVILFVKNFQNIFFATNVGFTVPMFYSMFRSALEATDVRLVASMNISLYEKIIAENEHILENFTVLELFEPEEDLTLKILTENALQLSKYHAVSISADVISYVYIKAKDCIKDSKFPQKGLDLLDQACSRAVMKKSMVSDEYKDTVDKTFFLARLLDNSIRSKDFTQAIKIRSKMKKLEKFLILCEDKMIKNSLKIELSTVEVDEVLDTTLSSTLSNKSGISRLGNINKLDDKLKKQIIGQNEAVDTVVRTLIRSGLGLRSSKRPLGNFLFLGPTGVGKTELAKVLAKTVFGEKSLIRLDMSDFVEKHNVARLVGAPPGYVGYGEGGELTQKIENKPDSVVLFDEIEKAHPDVLNILLQIMEEGELSDAKGNVFDFSKAVIILTSNLGTEILHKTEIGFEYKVLSDENVEDSLLINLKKILKPELLNRFDEIVVFKRLKRESQLRIINLLISEILDILEKQDINLKVAFTAKKYLLKTGYSEEYGARALRRVIEKELLDKVAQLILENKKPLNITVKALKKGLIFKVL